MGNISPLRDDDRYLRRLLPLWLRFVQALGDDAQVVARLEFSAETCLSVLNPGIKNADQLFDLMIAAIPTTRHISTHDHIGVLARFRPEGDAMRDLIMPIVLSHTRGHGPRNADTWAAMVAADIFADHFSQSPALLQQVIDRFTVNGVLLRRGGACGSYPKKA